MDGRRVHSFPLLLSFLSLLLLSSLSTISAAKSHFASALTFQVEPRAEVCFYEELQQGALFTMEFEVTRGGLLDIRLRVVDPAANTALEKMAFFNRHVPSTHCSPHPTATCTSTAHSLSTPLCCAAGLCDE